MTTTNVTKLSVIPSAKSKPISRAKRKTIPHQLFAASAVGLVAVTLTGLSLNHLASGIGTISHCETYQAWAMAVGVDCAFVSLELAQLTISDKLRTKLTRVFRPAILGTILWSAILNALAFASGADNLVMQIAGTMLGLSIPALVYALTKIGAAMWLDSR